MEILVYITDDKERVVGGNPLVLCMPDDEERQQYIQVLADTLKTEVLQMNNGDHMLIKR